MISIQRLDQKTIQRLEAAVSKSEYSQGKKLKVVPKVCFPWIAGSLAHIEMVTGGSGDQGRLGCRDRRSNNRPQCLVEDCEDE